MRAIAALAFVVFVTIGGAAHAAVITFDTDPFAGSTALTTPGRQVVGNELFVPSFDIATDVLAFDANVFGINSIQFANDVVGNLPSSGVNTIVLRTFDNDADPTTPFGAGMAANLIAGQVTSPGAGFFIYFNSNLDLARLVYSTNLDDNTADLKILARFLNLSGQGGRDALALFSADNFAVTQAPEPASLVLLALGGAWSAYRSRRRREQH